MKKINLYFDLDGVVFHYERQAYQGNNPIFNRVGSHYFRDLEPDLVIGSVISSLLLQKDTRRINKINFISTISPSHEMYLEMYKDKSYSLLELFGPLFDLTTFIACHRNKGQTIKFIEQKEKLEPTDILIDDFNRNLIEWEEQGGTAIKYINGVNSEDSWDGYIIKPSKDKSLEENSKDIIDFLYLFQSNLNPNHKENL